MPRVHWLDVPRHGNHRLMVGTVPLENEEASLSPLLRDIANLVARACTKLPLEGRYAFQPSRSQGLQLHILFEKSEDAHRFATVIGLPHPFEQQQARFVFDDSCLERLEAVGGPPARGSRQAARRPNDAASLAWAERPMNQGCVVREDD